MSFANIWRMDNPLTNFGRTVYQPDQEINLTVDAFGAARLQDLFVASLNICLLRPH